ncbi:MAG TPA: hypothetical protein VMF30_02645 [Pirellulales bacterium]|nr:hypothetical protein [Pirellulales bacterium]
MTETAPVTLQHPDVPRPASGWSESQTLHVAAAYSNPCRWQARRRLFNDFRRHMNAAANVRLYVGELAYGDRPHEVTGSHSGDLQLRTAHELWHKENILNRVIQAFPPNWKYGAYCDGDFHFTRHDWALEAIHQLQHFDFVQLFSTYSDLGRDHVPTGLRYGFVYARAQRLDSSGHRVPLPHCSGYGGIGSPGGAWAFRRSALEAVGGLLDICVLGSGDHHMAVGLARLGSQKFRPHLDTAIETAPYGAAIRNWQRRAAALDGNIGYVEAHAVHHYHGSKASRGYAWRPRLLRQHCFDPHRDLMRDAQGIYQLTDEKPQLRDDIRAYFRSRNEDS